jgi:hypothetical protein
VAALLYAQQEAITSSMLHLTERQFKQIALRIAAAFRLAEEQYVNVQRVMVLSP